MAKKYTHLRIEKHIYKELRKLKNLYELQDDKIYNNGEIILRLIDDRSTRQFKIPLVPKS